MNSILYHPLSDADELWLTTVAQSEQFDPRVARVQLYDKLPKDYDPTNIDRRFYKNDKLTVIGLRRFKPDSSLLKNMEVTAIAFKNRLLASPGIDVVEINPLCEKLGISRLEMKDVLVSLQDVAHFFRGMAPSCDGTCAEQVYFTGPSGYDGPLKFTTLDDALERYFSIQSNQPGLRAGNRSSLNELDNGNRESKAVKTDGRATTIKKKTAFVIMPIDSSRPELEDILDAIKSVAESFKIHAYRADEIEHQDIITNVVLEEIRRCEYLIADLSFERPNVYYEIGYAHALDKKPILYRKSGTHLHFDLSVHNVPEYSNVRELKELLKKRFEAILGRTAS